jgi:hypothetical protein
MDPQADPCRSFRRQVYVLLIVVAAAAATGRILSALRAYDPDLYRPEGAVGDARPAWPKTRPGAWPTFGSNDRSRFDAVRALVDDGTWVIGRRNKDVVLASAPVPLGASNVLDFTTLYAAARQARIDSDRGIVTEDGWFTVDRVLNPETLEFYSTKPPLLTAMAAGEYWLLKKTLGWSIVHDKNCVVRTIVWTFNVPLLVVYLLLLARLAERWGSSDWGRLYVIVAACFGTLLTPFLITFNNHTIGTCSALIALYAAVRILSSEDMKSGSGTGERPGGVRGDAIALPVPDPVRDPVPDSSSHSSPPHWGWFVLAGLFAGFTAANETPAAAFAVGLLLVLGLRYPLRTVLALVCAAVPPVALEVVNYLELHQWSLAYSEFGGPWYQYEGSNWLNIPGATGRGIDFARAQGETHLQYAFHLLLGHHGWFSLAPIHFLGLAGLAAGLGRLLRARRSKSDKGDPLNLWSEMAAATLLLSAVVFVFYVFKSDNYGGVSAGPRWLMWLAPLWLLAMLPVADWLGRRRWGRALAVVLLAFSVLSASYPSWNPWRHPWIYNWMDAWGRIPY